MKQRNSSGFTAVRRTAGKYLAATAIVLTSMAAVSVPAASASHRAAHRHKGKGGDPPMYVNPHVNFDGSAIPGTGPWLGSYDILLSGVVTDIAHVTLVNARPFTPYQVWVCSKATLAQATCTSTVPVLVTTNGLGFATRSIPFPAYGVGGRQHWAYVEAFNLIAAPPIISPLGFV